MSEPTRERVTTVERARVVIVRWSLLRWEWSAEEVRSWGHARRQRGTAFTKWGARHQALRAAHLVMGTAFRTEREEHEIARRDSFTRPPDGPEPLPSELAA